MTQAGAPITINSQLRLQVPDNPIVPFIEGDGTGPDIWRASVRVFDAVICRENTEDIYAGIEFAGGSPEAQKVLDFFAKEFPREFKKVRFGSVEATRQWQAQLEAIGAPKRDMPVQVGVGMKPISYL